MEAVMGFFAGVPIDYFVLGGIALIIATDSLRSGIGRASAIAVALPLMALFYSLFHSAAFLGELEVLSATPLAQALTVSAFFVLSYILSRRMGLEFIDGGMGEPIQSLIAGVAVAVIFTVVWSQLPALTSLWHFDSKIAALAAESFRLWWLLGAYAALAFARG